MELFSIFANIAILVLVSFVLFFAYTVYELSQKHTIKYINSKCPDYWTYDSSSNSCSYDTSFSDISYSDISLSSYPTTCSKYQYTIANDIVWDGISNNYNYSEVC